MAETPSSSEKCRGFESKLNVSFNSIEFKDDTIDGKWFRPGETQTTVPTGNKWLKKAKAFEAVELEDYETDKRPFYTRWYQSWKKRALARRLDEFEINEMEMFVVQKFARVDAIMREQEAKSYLMGSIISDEEDSKLKETEQEFSRKYGQKLVFWLGYLKNQYGGNKDAKGDRGCPENLDFFEGFNDLKWIDPLTTWNTQSPTVSERLMSRIHNFAASMSDMVKYSLIIEPGKLTPHLSEYVAEFRQLETFFERNQLCTIEMEQEAFNQNHQKVRNQMLECADETRVILNDPAPDDLNMNQDNQKVSDFIHASYVRGGPLMNTFIVTQAPLPSTICDFWRMILQEKVHMIIMLCGVYHSSLHDSSLNNSCPYYWPRFENDVIFVGDMIICNTGIDINQDPLFTVTHLAIRRLNEGDFEHTVDHWQYDWKDYNDYRWPLRILRRARLSHSPTVVQCFDGCGRSGTLVTIEAVLMHLLRASALPEKMVLTTAVFVRLQRRHAIMSPQQYLYIYRTILHWMQPYITSFYQRFVLGITYPEYGFIGKYDRLINSPNRL